MSHSEKNKNKIDFTEKFDLWINGTKGGMIFFDIHNKDGRVNYFNDVNSTYEECLNELYLWKLNKNNVCQVTLPDDPREKMKELIVLRDAIVEAERESAERKKMLSKYSNVFDFVEFKKSRKEKIKI